MALKLGSHTITFPYLLAPMAGITNAPFRLLMREYGAGAVVSELISATGIEYGGNKTLELCRYHEKERPVGLQVFGENPDHLAKAAQFVEAQGVDFVDINLGCPVPKIIKKGAGAAMLRDPLSLFKILQQVKKAIKIPLTIKIRTGWDSCSINANECVHAAAEAGVSWVAIHGRTRAQGYEGSADWNLIAAVKQKSPIPIIGNGDILTASQAMTRLQETGCDAVMIGRGALRNPFIFKEIMAIENDLGSTCYWTLITRHYELLKQTYSDHFVAIQLRKFLTWYSSGFEGAALFRKSLYSIPMADTIDKVFEQARLFFNRPHMKKQSSYLKEPFLKGGHG